MTKTHTHQHFLERCDTMTTAKTICSFNLDDKYLKYFQSIYVCSLVMFAAFFSLSENSSALLVWCGCSNCVLVESTVKFIVATS